MGTSLGVLLFPRPNPFSLMSLIHFVASTSTISHHAQLERQWFGAVARTGVLGIWGDIAVLLDYMLDHVGPQNVQFR